MVARKEGGISRNGTVTVTGAARLAGVPPAEVHAALEAGRFPGAFRLGGANAGWRIPLADLAAAGFSPPPETATRGKWSELRQRIVELEAEVASLRQALAVSEALAAERAKTIRMLARKPKPPG